MHSNIVPTGRAKSHATYTVIEKRLKNLGIELTSFFDDDIKNSQLKVYESSLDGISFKTNKKAEMLDSNNKLDLSKSRDFLTALRSAMTGGKPAFREGKVKDDRHIPIDVSMGATAGIGFREIAYLTPGDRGMSLTDSEISLNMRGPETSAVFSSQFGKTRVQLDITSLHCSVEGDLCRIHIDETGFVMGALPGMGSDVSVTPDFLQHTLLELLWKDMLDIPDSVEIYAPNSANDFSRFGLRGTANLTKNLMLSVDASYNVRGDRGFSNTIMLHGKFL